jgi:hypothetical protein
MSYIYYLFHFSVHKKCIWPLLTLDHLFWFSFFLDSSFIFLHCFSHPGQYKLGPSPKMKAGKQTIPMSFRSYEVWISIKILIFLLCSKAFKKYFKNILLICNYYPSSNVVGWPYQNLSSNWPKHYMNIWKKEINLKILKIYNYLFWMIYCPYANVVTMKVIFWQ